MQGVAQGEELRGAELERMSEYRERNHAIGESNSLGSSSSTQNAPQGLYTSASETYYVSDGSRWNGPARLQKPKRETPEEEEQRRLRNVAEQNASLRSIMQYPIQNPVDKKEDNVFDGHMDKRLSDYLNKEEEGVRFMPDMGVPYAPNHDPVAVAQWKAEQERQAAAAAKGKK